MNLLKLDKSYDLYLSMTWNKRNNHGISGHVYEIIDYFLLLKNKFKVGILICENMDWDVLYKAIVTKYNISNKLIEQIKNNTIFQERPDIVTGNNILFVDGGLSRTLLPAGIILKFNNIFSFRCSTKSTHYNLPYKNVTLFQDNRVYNDNDNKIAINYKKRINFNSLKKIKNIKTNTALIYATKNCRNICNDHLLDIIVSYKFDNYMVVTDIPEEYEDRFKDFSNVSFPEMPVTSIFEKFDTYIYTPAMLELCGIDCSPRFIAECKYYNKDVIYHKIDNNYLNIDTGLKYRKYDIDNDFQSLVLNDDDEIISLLERYINERS